MSLAARLVLPMLASVACLLGAYAMFLDGLSVVIWGQNVIASVALLLIVVFAPISKIRLRYEVIVIASVVLLATTLLFPGNDGVRRWIQIPAMSLNVAMIVIPVAAWCICKLFDQGKISFASLGTLLIALILLAQPDASQLTGFSLAIGTFLVANGRVGSLSRVVICGTLAAAALASWLFLDDLPPVSYVEGILGILGDVHPFLYPVGLVLLFLIPLPLILLPIGRDRRAAVCVAVYYWGISLSAFAWNFPIPMIGYGVSPIIGFAALLLVLRSENERLNLPSES